MASEKLTQLSLVTTLSDNSLLYSAAFIGTSTTAESVGITFLDFATSIHGSNNAITALTGDVTATGPGSVAATLSNTGVAAATYGDATHVGQFVVNAKGRITSASNVAITAGTVSSVALTMPTGFSVAGSPVTSSGTLAVTTSLSGIPKVSAGAFTNASAGTDYVAPGAVTTSGLTQATACLLGRTTASTGAIEEISVGSGLTLSAGSLSASGGGGGMSIGGTVTSGTAGSVLFVDTGPVLAQDNSNFFWDNTNKRLGIGTSSPRFTVDIRSDKSGIFGDLGASPGFSDIQWFIESTRNAGIARLGLFSSDGAGNGNAGALIESGQDGSTTTSYLSFKTRTGVSTIPEAGRFDSNSNFGVGTSTPSGRINIKGSSDSNAFLRVDGATSTVISTIGANETTGYGYGGTSSNHAFRFLINASEVARFDTSGNLLIGTTTTAGRLHVVGNYQWNQFDLGASPATFAATLYVQSQSSGQVGRISIGSASGGSALIEGGPEADENHSYLAFRPRTGVGATAEAYRIGSNLQLKTVAGNETTGGGSAALGANSPAVTNTAPYTWWKVTTSDGSQGYIPVWK